MAEEEEKKPQDTEEEVDKEEQRKEEERESTELIKQANEAAERLEEANKETAVLLAKQEQLKVETVLGGTADAGKQENTKEEKATESAKEMLAGTGMEDMAFPPEKKDGTD